MAQSTGIQITLTRAVLTDIYVSPPNDKYPQQNIYGVFRTASSSLRVSFKGFSPADIEKLALIPATFTLGVNVRVLADQKMNIEVVSISAGGDKPA